MTLCFGPAMQREPHVVMLLHGLYPPDPRPRREAEALVRAGFQVTVICTSGSGRRKMSMLNGVTMIETASTKRRSSLVRYGTQYLRTIAHAARELRRLMRVAPVDLVQIHTLPDFLIWAAEPARRRGIPLLLDLHESMPDFFRSKYGSRSLSLAVAGLELLERHCASRAHHLLTVNDEIADVFERRLGRRPTVIMNSADEELFAHDARPWPEGPKVLGYHGTLTPIYGVDLLLRALSQTLSRHPGTRLEIFGDGPARPELEQLCSALGIREAVTFRGRLPLEQMSARLADIDIGVVPTRKDAFLDMSLATKLLEYVYLGKPVVCSDLRAVTRLFGKGSVYAFAGNDVSALTAALDAVLGAGADEVAQRTAAASEIYETIAWPAMAERYVDTVRDLVAGQKDRWGRNGTRQAVQNRAQLGCSRPSIRRATETRARWGQPAPLGHVDETWRKIWRFFAA